MNLNMDMHEVRDNTKLSLAEAIYEYTKFKKIIKEVTENQK